MSAPTPVSAPILCPEQQRKSIFKLSKLKGDLPRI